MIAPAALIEKLQSIHESDRAAIELIAMGDRAVPALREFLLCGKRGTVYQPRMIAAEVLGRIGAKDVLLEFLKTPVRTADPAVRFAEEAVRSTAARELASWPGEDVASAIMDALRQNPLPGACDAAGRLRLISAAPYLIDALADDVSRPRAMEALRRLLPAATPLLIETALLWLRNSRADETPALYRKVLAAVTILSGSRLSEEEATKLGPLMESEDPGIIVCVARILLDQPCRDAAAIARALIGVLPRASSFDLIEIRELLTSCGPEVLEPLDSEIQRRAGELKGEANAAHPKPDMLLPMLVNVRQRVAAAVRL